MSTTNKIRELREGAGYSQAELAKMLYVNQTAVSQWERGVTTPSKNTLQKLCEIFGVSADYLLEIESAYCQSKDEELLQLREDLRRNPELRMLFSASKNASKEDLLKAVKIINALKGDE